MEELHDSDPELDQDPSIDRDRIFARARNALSQQLDREYVKVDLALRVADESVTRAKGKRETLGVDLYNLQQALAKMQMALEQTHDKFAVTTQLRVQSDEKLQQAHDYWREKKQEVGEMEKKIGAAQRELDVLRVTLKQVDDYNEKVDSEIQVTKRIAYAAEDDIKKTEVKKNQQDLLIDSLNEQAKTITAQIKIYAAQIEAQKSETKSAMEMLKEAQHEMSVIVAEKKEYTQKWKSSLIAIAKRDEAMQAAETELRKEQEEIQTLQLEIRGLQKQTRKEQETNERLTVVLLKLQSDQGFVESQLAKVIERKEKISKELTLLRHTLEHEDAQLASSLVKETGLKSQVSQLEKQIERLVRERRGIEDKMYEVNNDRTTAEKGAVNVRKETVKIHRMITEKEERIAETQNEIARIKVDTLNTTAHNKELKQTLDDCEQEFKEKETLIEKYEIEIRQRHDEIEKKQIYIDRLNRKFDALVSNMEDENTGPLEATINNLSKEINAKVRDEADLQRVWIRAQTDLVEVNSSLQGVESVVSDLAAQEHVLGQKRRRLEVELEKEKEFTKELAAGIRSLHSDMTRINEIIAKNTKIQEDLMNSTYAVETEFTERLAVMAVQTRETDVSIAECKAERLQILDSIVEAERQVMLWEKKIALEKETQDALDPEVGNAEVAGMKREIHRMEIRLSQLKRKQEVMMSEMERAIDKKEDIETRGSSTKSKTVTAATLKQKNLAMKSQIKQYQSETRAVENEILRQEQDNTLLAAQVEQLQNEYNTAEDTKIDLVSKVESASWEKQLAFEKLQMLQKRVKRYDASVQGITSTEWSLEETLDAVNLATEKTAKFRNVFQHLLQQHPKQAYFFQKLIEFCDE